MKKEKKEDTNIETSHSKLKTTASKSNAQRTKVGTMLKNVRLEKDLNISDVAAKLCIRKLYLEAIEESDYDRIPAFPYCMWFIRSYANFLGLNGDNIVELYKEETFCPNTANITSEDLTAKSAAPSKIYVLISLVALLVLYAGWSMLNDNNETTDMLSPSEQVSDDVVVIEEVDIPDVVAPEVAAPEQSSSEIPQVEKDGNRPERVTEKDDNKATTAEPKSEVNAQPLDIPAQGIYIEILKETWIEVKTADKLYISKVLQAGDSYRLPEEKGLLLSVGKIGGVNVYVDGVKTDIAQSGKKMNIDIDSFLGANR